MSDDTVYKVVAARYIEGELTLTSANLIKDPEYCLTYSSTRKTYPALEGSYLYAFNDLDTALAYPAGAAAILKPSVQLWVFEAQARVVCENPSTTYTNELGTFWEEHWHAHDYPFWPVTKAWEHSVWCEWIQLGERLQGIYPMKALEDRKRS